MVDQDLVRIRNLLEQLEKEEIAVQQFCAAYEKQWNHETNQQNIPDVLHRVLSKLFDEVVLHSPIEKEKWGYAGYRTDEEIRLSAHRALARINQHQHQEKSGLA